MTIVQQLNPIARLSILLDTQQILPCSKGNDGEQGPAQVFILQRLASY